MILLKENKLYIKNDRLIIEIYAGDNLYEIYDFNLSEVLKVFETLLEEVNI